jgi:hypothetical protein
MKKTISFFFLTLIATYSFAQIPNPSFEDIKNITESNAAYWYSTGKAEQSTDANGGTYAIKQYGGTSQFGNIISLTVGTSAFSNQVPYEGRPTHLEFYIKGNLVAGDSLFLVSNLTSNGNTYGVASLDLTTLSNNYFKVKTPITIIDSSNICDSITLGFYFQASDSSYFILDDVKYTNNNVEEGQIVNGDFETWVSTQYRKIEGWSTSNDIGKAFGFTFNAVKDTSDASDGLRAIYMQNISFFGQVIPGAIVTGINNIDQGPAFPVSSRYKYFNGHYKYKPSTNDTFSVDVIMFYQGNEIGTGKYRSTATVNKYQKFSCEIIYDSVLSVIPDSANIIISAGSLDAAVAGSKAWVDQLSFEAVGIDNIIRNEKNVSIYPNPTKDYIYINFESNTNEYIYIQLYNLEGKLLKNIYQGKTLNNYTQISSNTSEIPSGIYIVSIQSGSNIYHQKIQVIHE